MHTPPALPTTQEAAEALMDAVAPMLGLAIPAECRAGVIANLQRTASIAAHALEFELAPEDEPAPVFSAGSSHP